MRPIKYRIWDIKKQRFDDDLYIDCDGEICRPERDKYGENVEAHVSQQQGARFAVNQYIGVKDNEGEELYERDIVEFTFTYTGVQYKKRFVVLWAKLEGYGVSCFGLKHIFDIGDYCEVELGLIQGAILKETKRIGNIYENPELLNNDNH